MSGRVENLWDPETAAGMSEPELLLYRSNLLGSDLKITNFGGGNTSAKLTAADPLTGVETDVLWVKGSGGDVGSMKLDGFATLYLDKVRALRERYEGLAYEDRMVDFLPHCTFNLNPRAASIDTPLHAFIPHRHVDHMHPDAVIAIACAHESETLTKKIFEARLGWVPWQRPGFDLGLKLGEIASQNPQLDGVVLQGHGLFTWGETSKACYETTIEIIQIASDYLQSIGDVFSPAQENLFDGDERARIAMALMPAIRGKISANERKVGHFIDSAVVLDFVNSGELRRLAAIGTSCPDHFLRTKIRPLVLDAGAGATDAAATIDAIIQSLDATLESYRADYIAYYERCRNDQSPAIRDANAVVYLIPKVGMITFARDKATARIAGEFYVNAINVMRGAESLGGYVGLPEKEAFNIEYWSLEEAKLRRMPDPKPLAGRVAFVTGGAGGIGAAAARRLIADGACVVLADIDSDAAKRAAGEIARDFSADVVTAAACDVTDEKSVADAFNEACLRFSGIDILVSNAGIASAAALDETSLAMWTRNIDVLTTGYFLVSREAFKIMKMQGLGGSIVFVGSKNSLVASANAAAYCTAKGAELQLARSIALEGAQIGVRCNVVNPDAVIQGSKIWDGKWRKDRAAAYGIPESDLEAHYRRRSLLQLNVLPEDIAEAIAFFSSDLSSKSTGNIINVDAGHAPSFTR